MQTYHIEFTLDELERLNGALNAASVFYGGRELDKELHPEINIVNSKFREETNALWMRIVKIQKIAIKERAHAA